MSIPKVVPLRQGNIGINNGIVERALKDIKKDDPQTQAGSHSRLQNPALKVATYCTTEQELKQRPCHRPIFFKINLDHGIFRLSKAMKTRAGDVLAYLIKNTRYGNKVSVSPKIISSETGIHLTHVSRYLKALVTEGDIARDKSDSGANIFMICPAIGVAGDSESEETAWREWERLKLQCTKKQTRKVLKRSVEVAQIDIKK